MLYNLILFMLQEQSLWWMVGVMNVVSVWIIYHIYIAL